MHDFDDSSTRPIGVWVFLGVLLVVSALAIVFAMFVSSASFRAHPGPLEPGEPTPPITAAGWVNGAPQDADLRGRVTLVHAWYTTCPHCRSRVPELHQLYEAYHPRGVEFIGLTFEEGEQLAEIEEFVHETGMTWPNGYGAKRTLDQFGTHSYPFAWVIGPDGRVLWNSDYGAPADEALTRALQPEPGK
jgi:thiol-disulfide isomerase/thioredoxin